MKLFFSFVFALLAFTACTKPEKEVYIFTSHREPALDGLHYLYSYDGYHWDSIAGSWLKPESCFTMNKPFPIRRNNKYFVLYTS